MNESMKQSIKTDMNRNVKSDVKLNIRDGIKQNLKHSVALLFGCAMILGALWVCRQEYAQAVQMSLAEKVLRFHVIAQSDSQEDQRIKLLVRDEVSVYVTQLLQESDSLEETVAIIQANMDEINEVANQVLAEEGVSYTAETSLAYVEFPQKEYNEFVFPEGEYQALKIVLGEGKGQNWWCVMYPNLCFKGSVYKTNEEELDEFEEVLTPSECESIMDGKEYTIRFKLLEYICKKLYN